MLLKRKPSLKKKVTLHELGGYIRIINLDYPNISNNEMAKLISENFNVICTEKDINGYENLHKQDTFIKEDYELEYRRTQYKQYY